RAVEAATRCRTPVAIRDPDEVARVRDDADAERVRDVAPVDQVMAPRLGSVDDPMHMGAGFLRRAGRASLGRAHGRERGGEGAGEQQYEKADWPHEKVNSRRWARPSQSAVALFRRGSALQHRTIHLVSPEWVSRRNFRQIDAGSTKSLYFACAACTRVSSCSRV